MPRQYAREPLSRDEGTRLIQACETLRERQLILILLDTGLRVSELGPNPTSLLPEAIRH
jgi:integrase